MRRRKVTALYVFPQPVRLKLCYRPCASCVRKGYECIERACKACSREGLAAECNHRKVINEGTSENPGRSSFTSYFEFSFISFQKSWTTMTALKHSHPPRIIDHHRHSRRLLCRWRRITCIRTFLPILTQCTIRVTLVLVLFPSTITLLSHTWRVLDNPHT